MADKKEIRFTVDSFEIGDFSTSKPKGTIRKDRIDFQIQHLFNVNAEEKKISVGFRIIVMPGRQSKEELASLETFTTFKIKGVDKGDMNNLPEHLVVTCLSIAYSTTRGALAAKAQGTIIGEVPLPLINPTQVIEEMKQRVESDG